MTALVHKSPRAMAATLGASMGTMVRAGCVEKVAPGVYRYLDHPPMSPEDAALHTLFFHYGGLPGSPGAVAIDEDPEVCPSCGGEKFFASRRCRVCYRGLDRAALLGAEGEGGDG